jgi:hypothetical protein
VRGALITYGIAAYAYLVPQPLGSASSPFPALDSPQMLLIGIASQVLVLAGRGFAKRQEGARGPDERAALGAVFVLELLADGITVLMFALATYGPILRFANEV